MILGLVLGLGIPIAAGVPTTIGVAEGVSYQQKQNASAMDDEKRMAKFQVEVYCEGVGGEDETGNKGKGKSKREREVHGRRLGVRDGKVGLVGVSFFLFVWVGRGRGEGKGKIRGAVEGQK